MANPPPATSKSLNLGKPPFLRGPRLTDDLNTGYAVGDLWNFDGRIFEAKNLTAGKAAWAEIRQDRNTCLTDAVGNAAASYGFIKTRAAYTGPACRVVRASDGTTFDVPFMADGWADAAALRSFLAGTTGKFDILYDHQAGALHATQTVDANRPPVGFKTIHGRLVVTFASLTGNVDRVPNIANAYWFDLPAGLSVTRNAFTSLMVVNPTNQSYPGSTSQALGHVMYELGPSSGNVISLYQNYANFNMTAAITGTSAALKQGMCGPQVQIAAFSPSAPNITFHQNNETATSNTINSSGTSAGGRLGMGVVSSQYPGRFDMGVAVFWTRTLSATEIKTAKALCMAQWGIVPQSDVNIVYEGDSLEAGYTAANNENGCDQIDRLLGERTRRVNICATGYKLQDMNANYASRAGACYVPGKRNILVLVAPGGNDILSLGRTGTAGAALIYNDWAALVGKALAQGYVGVIAGTIMDSTTFYGTTNTDPKWIAKDTFNGRIVANPAGATVIDFKNLPALSPASDTSIFPDGAHLGAYGHSLHHQPVADVARGLIKRAA